MTLYYLLCIFVLAIIAGQANAWYAFGHIAAAQIAKVEL